SDCRARHSFPTRRSSDLKPPGSSSVNSENVAVSVLVQLMTARSRFGSKASSAWRHGSWNVLVSAQSSRAVFHMNWAVSSASSERSEEHTSELQSRENLVC